MIRGVDKVVNSRNAEAGRFYLASGYGGAPHLLQCVQFVDSANRPALQAVFIPMDGTKDFLLGDLPEGELLVALPHVAVRIDAPSVIGTKFTMRLQPGTLVVAESDAVLVVPNSRWGWSLVSLTQGATAEESALNWIAFSRWSLVIDEGGEEVAIASFGGEA